MRRLANGRRPFGGLLLLWGLAGCALAPTSPDELTRSDSETGEECRGWTGKSCGARGLLVAACNVGGERCELRRTDGRIFTCDAGCDCDAAATRALSECDE